MSRTSASPIRVAKRQEVYRGRQLAVVREELEIAGHRVVRETIQHPGSAVIVPVRPDGRLVFVRQYRRAIGRSLLELPAGTLDHGPESALACAKRELEEETGWRASRWSRLGWFYPAPGFLSERMTMFLASGLRAAAAHPEPDEFVTPVALTWTQAQSAVRTGRICDAKSIIGLLFAARRLGRVRRVDTARERRGAVTAQ